MENTAARICAVIFDMDGVLTDSEGLINAAAIAMFAEKGLVVQPDNFLPFVGAGEDRYIGGVAEKYGFPLDLSAAKARTYEIYLELVPVGLNAFPGAVELVKACRRAGLLVGAGFQHRRGEGRGQPGQDRPAVRVLGRGGDRKRCAEKETRPRYFPLRRNEALRPSRNLHRSGRCDGRCAGCQSRRDALPRCRPDLFA